MKTRTFCAIAIGLLSLALTSCQNNLDLLKPSQDTEPEQITQLGSSIADGLVAQPSGDGWKFGGKGKGKLDAIHIGYELSKILGENQDFEIYVEYNGDGSYTVWYREVQKSSKGSNP